MRLKIEPLSEYGVISTLDGDYMENEKITSLCMCVKYRYFLSEKLF